ncbi:MAG: rhodanese-like domain-containing protein [Gammaproteobacteria bacterium]|nr:rhodanese-like domain-containing protein [Gammaproteobacteria bacterium]
MIEELKPLKAWDILKTQSDVLLLDVRSSMEYEYVGHVPGSVFVALKEPPDWLQDAGFVARVRRSIKSRWPDKNPEDMTILALCRSGARSLVAAEELSKNGFKQIYNVGQGFEGDKDEQQQRGNINGWRFHGLPWEQS